MFYDAIKKNHGLPHDPFKAIVTPRPIGWISTQDAKGRHNLAPYSFFNALCDRPPIVMFSSDGMKDSASNAQETGVFACNLATYALKDAMNASSAPLEHGVSEFERAGLTPVPCDLIDAPRIKEAAVVMECETLEVKPLVDRSGQEASYTMVIGQVVGIHIDDSCLVDGLLDTALLKPIARLGYRDYAVVDAVFQLTRPDS
ncbi:flavin reductase family protein [Pararhizobium sp. IMCC21322]|uniref:flavin reductase family protein n=1 Tax=Pararhizobium sp. IMCC21322 TaxID=3067903 RepID=UPI002740E41E|nr:flavin reductase family protein [Pararhizobium sp. IMCC21322]